MERSITLNVSAYLISSSLCYNLPFCSQKPFTPLGLWHAPRGRPSLWMPRLLCSGSAFPCQLVPPRDCTSQIVGLSNSAPGQSPPTGMPGPPPLGVLYPLTGVSHCVEALVILFRLQAPPGYPMSTDVPPLPVWDLNLCSEPPWLTAPSPPQKPTLHSLWLWTELFRKERKRGREKEKLYIQYNNEMTMKDLNLSTNPIILLITNPINYSCKDFHWSDNCINRNLGPG